ncbi:MAG TPA: hypothetical protein DD735_06280 [Clostridiales bacterium]|nr:hypothetical protein [Clostridiales bacterium]
MGDFRMNERQITCFLAVRKHLNFSAAAVELFITQPALTYQIRSLENELGVKLFDRTTTSVSLTEASLAFAVQANKFHQLLLETDGVMRDYVSARNRIVLGCPRMMMVHDKIYPLLMSRVIEAFPQYDVDVRTYKSSMKFPNSLSGGIDCVIGAEPAKREEGVAYYPLFESCYYLVVWPQSTLLGRKSIAPAELYGQTLYYERDERFFARMLRRMLEQNGVTVSFKEVATYDTIFPNFLAGKGFFISPVINGAFPPELYVPIETDELPPPTVLMCLKDPPNPCVPALTQIILQTYRENGPNVPEGPHAGIARAVI